MIVGIELDGGAIRVGRAGHVAPWAQLAPHQVVLQNLGEHALGERRIWIELHRQPRFRARSFAHAGLKQHIGHLQMVHGRIGISATSAR